MKLPGPILLVDDEAHIRKYVGLILKQLGAPVVIEAANGEEALAAFQRERPALVLLDVNMPKMDGLEALQRMKQQDPSCIVIMLTSLANRETVEKALELGAANYLRKDTPKEEMMKTLEETIAATNGDE